MRFIFKKIDEIAMTFSVQAAIDAKERVERVVNVPPGLKMPASREEELEESSFDI